MRIKISPNAAATMAVLFLFSIGANIAALADKLAASKAEPAVVVIERETQSDTRGLYREFSEAIFRSRMLQVTQPATSRLLQAIWRLAPEYGLDPELVTAIVMTESGGDPRAAHPRSGCLGLMQVNFAVWQDELQLERSRILEPEYNLRAGMEILRRYLAETKGDIEAALHRYNMGYAGENPQYLAKVQANLARGSRP